MRLLINAPTGLQEVIEITESGAYFNSTRVLWDERVDGALPLITVGEVIRQGNSLVFDAARKATHNAALLTNTQTRKISALNASCDAAVTSGFTSTALGTAHTYLCGPNDQTQLTAQAFDAYRNAAVLGWTCWLTCKNLAGVKARREHTSAQILLVADAGKLHVATQLSNRDTKVTLVNAALTVEQINAVTW